MALGSLTEIQNQLLVARDIGYLTKEEFNKIAEQSIKLIKLLMV
jgi:four helix bundle protein